MSTPTPEEIAAAQEVLRQAAVPVATPEAPAAAPAADPAPTPTPVPDRHLLTLQAHASYLGLAEAITDDVIDVWNRVRPITDSEHLKQLAHALLMSAALFIGK